MRCGKGFLKCSLILFVYVNHTLHNLSHRLMIFRLDDLKAIVLTTGIGTHDSCVVFQPLEEFVACMRLLDVHWVPILR